MEPGRKVGLLWTVPEFAHAAIGPHFFLLLSTMFLIGATGFEPATS